MLRKPSYCCNCGDKAERIEWHIWNSRKFCELCETEFVFDEWWPRVAVAVIFVFGFTGIGFHYGGNARTVLLKEQSIDASRRRPLDTIRNSVLREPEASATAIKEAKSTEIPQTRGEQPVKKGPAVFPESAAESGSEAEISYCGAMTKKGTPCARRVKNGGRCWQHEEETSQ